jgi:hypothetical protein
MGIAPFQDVCSPSPAGFDSFPQATRNFRIGVSASTHFIGGPENNFSHLFNEPWKPTLSHPRATCAASLHTLSQSTPIAAQIRATACPVALQAHVPLRCSQPRSDPISAVFSEFFPAKKSAAEGSPSAAIGFLLQPYLLSACKPV